MADAERGRRGDGQAPRAPQVGAAAEVFAAAQHDDVTAGGRKAGRRTGVQVPMTEREAPQRILTICGGSFTLPLPPFPNQAISVA
ncbi:hypothetical protein GCM10012287_18140 [Streptomyces daqingensis]|uniref:Uncharacterized protein n=1 Tax=Streptomyces daqingensis TaxID=1472640 RepID=A0ABQ2M3X4_9ACTN|nr:hypothetical protein GCM10012287_18140 [Streptomyces daqingensis]